MANKIPENIQKEIKEKGGLEQILVKIPKDKEIKKIAQIHHALSDPIRLKILFFLYYQSSCVCLIKNITGLAYSKLSYHLKILREAGFIKCKKSANYIFYSVSERGKFFVEHCDFK